MFSCGGLFIYFDRVMTLIHAQIWYKNHQSECVCKQWMVVNGSRNVYSSPPKLNSFLVWFLSEKVKDLLKYTKLEGRFAVIFCIKLQNREVKIVFWLQVNISNQVNTNCWVNLKEREVEMTRSTTEVPLGKVKQEELKTTGTPMWSQTYFMHGGNYS